VFSEFVARHDAQAVVHQIREHAKFMTGHTDGDVADGHASGARIESERAATQLGMSEAAGPPDERSNACHDLFDLERFCDVVVRAAVDPLDLFVPTAACRENEHRRDDAGFAPAAKQREAIYPRQSQVEDHSIVLLGVRKKISLLAVGGAIDGVAALAERIGQLAGQQWFVLND